MRPDIHKLSNIIGYEFKNQDYLLQALTHRSFSSSNNERLEFLGDAVLGLVVAAEVYQRFPQAKEGQLSRLRASLVKSDTLAALARELNLGDYLQLGIGELKSGGFSRQSTLEDAIEAILGAVFLDSDFATAAEVAKSWLAKRFAKLDMQDLGRDSKSKLQERLQAKGYQLPVYNLESTSGLEHEQVFNVSCYMQEAGIKTVGSGNSKKQAEQNAAAEMLEQLASKKI